MIIDTHTHLYLDEFKDENEEVVKRAIDAGVGHMIFPNVDVSTIEPMNRLAALFPDNVSMGMGLHPTEIKEDWKECLAQTNEELNTGKYVAVGEIGIDLYWDKTFEEEQMQTLDTQLAKAEELGIPAIIHCREGLDQTLEVLRSHPEAQAVFHSFGGNAADIERIRNVGDYFFGINGIVTFKNCQVRETIPEITLERLMLETDAPYLAPVPFRGKRNESAYMVNTAKHIADFLSIPFDTLASATTANAIQFFKLIPSGIL